MEKKKYFWIGLLVQLVIALGIVAWLYSTMVDDLNPALYEHQRYTHVPQAWPMICASNALFVPAVMWLGVAGMMWIATTGFFDIFSYAFKSLLVLFTPIKRPGDMEKFFDYKLAKEEKRKEKAVPWAMLIVGAMLLLASTGFNIAYNHAMDPYLNSDAHQQVRQEALMNVGEAPEEQTENNNEHEQ